jgi:outer membrane immunogenic protein
MSQNSLVRMLLAGVVGVAMPAFSQTEGPAKQEVAVQGFGSFVKTTTQNGIDNTATNSGGVLASYRYFFSKHNGVEASYGYTLDTQAYALAGGPAGIDTNTHQISGAYVFRMPLHKITPYALAGAGAMVFDPKNFSGASTQTRAAFVYGAGADIDLTHRIFLRAEYRGYVYNSPTYDVPALNGLDRVTHRAEPSVGFGFTF